jgi:putative holliday junction resolvase
VSAVIGLDHGSRRIGVAVGSLETGQAFARPALLRSSQSADLQWLADLASSEGATLVVIGLPRNMDGSEGAQAAAARVFGAQLLGLGLEVAYIDERLTSWEAGERLAAEGRRPGRMSGERDSAAARLILQEYLDARATPHPPQETA